jgi:hypothetical protein
VHIRFCACSDDAETVSLTLAEEPGRGGLVIDLTFFPDLDTFEVVCGDRTAKREPVQAWSLVGSMLSIEYDHRSARDLGVTTVQRLLLDVDENTLARARDQLVRILADGTCFLVDSGGLKLRQ